MLTNALELQYLIKLTLIMAFFIQTLYCKGIMDVTDKDIRFKENTCLKYGSVEKE